MAISAAAETGQRAQAVLIKGGRSFVGVNDPVIPADGEGPERPVKLNDFRLEACTVTVERFAQFVAATGYRTQAEQFGWSSVFVGGGNGPGQAVGAGLSWWHRVDGASWQHPEGPGSSVAERMDHPVTHVSVVDAEAFAQWAGGRLPSEAEWEHAARGGALRRRFPWGDEEPDDEQIFCNIWQGQFPRLNTGRDGYEGTAPARSFAPNALGLYNMVGNVWEWTAEPFRIRSVSLRARERYETARQHGERLLKGGSFLCHKSYCFRYRIAARMGLSADSSASNVGFRLAFAARPA
ncbi:MAG: hypothetical protein K0R85_2360 [Devosia sp.]|nr:hypothetical protein [Devosia sp.]